jgi:hypothetical protein
LLNSILLSDLQPRVFPFSFMSKSLFPSKEAMWSLRSHI